MIRSHTVRITPELLSLVAGIDEFKGAWRALGTLAPTRLLALRRVAIIESIGSSTRIGGSTLSDREIEWLLSNRPVKSFTTSDEQDVAGYAEIMNSVLSSWQDITLSEDHIKRLHRDLLTYSEKDVWHRGNYCKISPCRMLTPTENREPPSVVFETPVPDDTPRLMSELVTWFHEERSAARLHPLLLISIWLAVFLEIRPFQNGNGRLSCVLTTLLLLQAGYAYVPYGSLESVIEQREEAYHLALRQTQGTIRTEAPNWQPWLVFLLQALAEQACRLNRKVEREKLVLAALPELSLQIVEFVREHGRITMGKAIRLTGSNRNTLKQHFRILVARGQLSLQGSGRGVWYELG
jgi:Fic family protein